MKDEVKIPVSLPGAAQASADAGRVAQGLEKINKATGDQAKQSQQAAKGLNELGEATEKGAAVGRIFGEVARGNIFALTNLGAVLKATSAAVKTSVFGVLLIGATALLNVLPGLIQRLSGSKDETQKLAKEADEAKAALEKMAQVRLESLKSQLDAVAEGSKAALGYLDLVNSAAQRIENARMAVELAEVNADQSLTPEQKRSREVAIRDKYARSSSQRERSAIDERVFRAEQDFQQYDAIASTAESERDRFLSGRQGVLAERARIEQEKRDIDALARTPGGLGPALERQQRLEEQERKLGARESFIQSPEWRARNEVLDRAAREARGRASGAWQNLTQERLRADVDQSQRPVVLGLESRARRLNAGIPDPVSKISPGARMDDAPGRISYAIEEAGARTGAELGAAMVEAVNRAFEAEKEKFREQLKALQR